ncbi:unnamed protein product, partial [Eruca vesicaria subsp. sativa]|nr:unnamed protein product [Eruca vesicaria subsp. sativa]
ISSDLAWQKLTILGKNASWSERTKQYIRCRIQTVENTTKKFHTCIKQSENRCPSGASNDDIFQQAKIMFMDDPKYK